MSKSKLQTNIPDIDYGNLMRLKYNEEWVTYKQLCECLNIPYLNSNSKKKQLKELSSICNYEKNGTKFKINDICSNKYEYIRYNAFSNSFNVKYKFKNKSGIYKIQLNNDIYIGETSDFRKRYLEHYNNTKQNLSNSNIISYILKNNGTFEIIEFENDINLRKQKEKEYINKYSVDNNYNCLNDNHNLKLHNKKEKFNKNINLKKK